MNQDEKKLFVEVQNNFFIYPLKINLFIDPFFWSNYSVDIVLTFNELSVACRFEDVKKMAYFEHIYDCCPSTIIDYQRILDIHRIVTLRVIMKVTLT